MRIILAGFGTVGQALAKILYQEKERLVNSYGFEPEVTTIVDSHGFVSKAEGLDLRKMLETKKQSGMVGNNRIKGKDILRVIREENAEVLVETTPSNFTDGEPGLSHIKQGLTSNKHVVTSNKGPLVLAMPALLELASHHDRQLLFSATVGAGTPFLSFAAKSLSGLEIQEIRGILNGTTNYILTLMEEKSLSFENALEEAKRKGYAETDPKSDIEGCDTAAKLVIIANSILKQNISLEDVNRTGITKITRQELKQAASTGKRIKLIGRLTRSSASVKPEAIPVNDPTCVPGTLNALTFSTRLAGDMTLIGPGSGGEQTASAILRDLTEIRSEYQT